MPILVGTAVSKRFGGLVAVNAVDFEIREGEIFGLIGPNGAGKTTLFRLLSGIYKPSSGSIALEGREIGGLAAHAVCARGVVTTHQIVRPFPEMTVAQNVTVGLLYGRQRLRGAAADAEVDRILEMTELAPHRATLGRSLTLARRKRLEVARALATSPRVLLLDEVAAGLNPTESARIIDLIRKIRESGVSIVMVEHVMKAIMSLSDRIMVMDLGKRIALGTPAEIAKDPSVIKAYLGDRAVA
ncbi:MAG TPA: ABC transporter ATP-binding protein [Candidatus Saccharimonadales bacterium]|nr:ABC transporter ATP-binding protein [Candidatus Saccharimonadales bacterium]